MDFWSLNGPQNPVDRGRPRNGVLSGQGPDQEGHSIEQATNGQDGLFRATDGSFDLIILDRMLPVLDGLSVLKALRAARIDTPGPDPLSAGLGR